MMKWEEEILKVKCTYHENAELCKWSGNCPTCGKEWFHASDKNITHVCTCGTNFMLVVDKNEIALSFEELINNG